MRKNCFNCTHYDGDKQFGICNMNGVTVHSLEYCRSFEQNEQKKGQNQEDTNRLVEINIQINKLMIEADGLRVFCTHEDENGESAVYDCGSHMTCPLCHQSW